MYFYTLLAALLAVVLIFVAPLRAKVWVATSLIGASAIGALYLVVATLLGGEITLARFSTDFFGAEHITVDALSALFLAIIAIASVATVVYSRRGLLQAFLGGTHLATLHLACYARGVDDACGNVEWWFLVPLLVGADDHRLVHPETL